MLRQPREQAGGDRRPGHERPQLRVDRAERRAVARVQREPGERPLVAAGHELAEQLDVVVVALEGALVERLLGRPHHRGHAARDGSPEAALKLHRPRA